MEYVYFLENASLTLCLVNYLHRMPHLPVKFVTVVSQIDGWVVNVKMKSPLKSQQSGDFQAFLNELGSLYSPPKHVNIALWNLEAGENPIDVMRRYQVFIVAHGSPKQEEIEAFREQMIKNLGYCPNTLA